jgi:phenylpyruvate tautomerase PptA (4-oxalocrotonate tautomerase family)
MPIVKVWCLPDGQTEGDLQSLYWKLVHAVLVVNELGLRDDRHDVTFLFPTDRMKFGLGEEIIVEIGGLYEKTERTKEVQDKLAAAVGKVIKETYPEAKVKVFVSTFNPTTSGLWQSE